MAAMIAGCGGGGHTPKPSSDASVGAPIAHTTTAPQSATRHARRSRRPPAPNLVALRAALSSALSKGGPQTRRARLRPDRQADPVLAAGQRRTAAGVGGEALHDGGHAQRARPERPPQDHGGRRRPPRARRRLAREPVSGRRRRPDVRRRRLQQDLGAGLRPDRQPAREPARPRRDQARHRLGDRRRRAVRRAPRGSGHRLPPGHPRLRRPAFRAELRPRLDLQEAEPGRVRRQGAGADDARRRASGRAR